MTARPTARLKRRPRRPGSLVPIVLLTGLLVVLLVLLARTFLGGGGGAQAGGRGPTGDPYRVVLGETEASPDLLPVRVGDSLRVRVRYAGDCEDHRFRLRDEARGDTTRLTLVHDARRDACEGEVYEELRLLLPENLPATGPLVLVDPEGGAPFALR